MTAAGNQFVLLNAALGDHLPSVFRHKPKVHLFLHLVQEPDPRATWT